MPILLGVIGLVMALFPERVARYTASHRFDGKDDDKATAVRYRALIAKEAPNDEHTLLYFFWFAPERYPRVWRWLGIAMASIAALVLVPQVLALL